MSAVHASSACCAWRHADTGRPHVGDHLRARRGIQPAGALDLGRGSRSSALVAIEQRQVDGRCRVPSRTLRCPRRSHRGCRSARARANVPTARAPSPLRWSAPRRAHPAATRAPPSADARRRRTAPHRRPPTARGCSCSGARSRPSSAASVSRARSRSCCAARRTTSVREASVRGARASRSLMSPARRRASVMSASRRVSSAFSVARARRRSAVMASACAVLTCATSESASHTSRSPMACALRRAAATRAGRCTKRVEGILQREFELLGSEREEQREDGIAQQSRFREIGARDAEIDERRLKGRTVPERDRDGLFLRQAVRQIDVGRKRGSTFETNARRRPFGRGWRHPRSTGVGAPFIDAHPALTTATLVTSTRVIIRTFTMRDERRRRHRKQGAGRSRKMPSEIERCGNPSIPRISGMISAPT